jgi:hypothetical protein
VAPIIVFDDFNDRSGMTRRRDKDELHDELHEPKYSQLQMEELLRTKCAKLEQSNASLEKQLSSVLNTLSDHRHKVEQLDIDHLLKVHGVKTLPRGGSSEGDAEMMQDAPSGGGGGNLLPVPAFNVAMKVEGKYGEGPIELVALHTNDELLRGVVGAANGRMPPSFKMYLVTADDDKPVEDIPGAKKCLSLKIGDGPEFALYGTFDELRSARFVCVPMAGGLKVKLAIGPGDTLDGLIDTAYAY